MTWSTQAMLSLVMKKLRKPVTSLRMDQINCSGTVINELLQFIVDQIADEGLQQLRFSEFHAKIELDQVVLGRLAQKSQNLQLLTIRDMNRTSEQVREALV